MASLTAPLLHNPIFVFAVMLLGGALAGRLLQVVRLPVMTGYILLGIALGPQAAHVIGAEMMHPLAWFTEVALGVIAFNIGSSFDRKTLSDLGFGVVLVTLGQATVVLVLVAGAALLLGMSLDYALLLGVLGFPAGPTMTYLLLRDMGIRGPFATFVFGSIALGDVLTVIAFGVLKSLTISGLGGGAPHVGEAIKTSLVQQGTSLGVGMGLAVLILPLLWFAKRDSRLGRDQRQALFFGALLAAIGVAAAFDLSHLLTPLGTGMVLANGIDTPTLNRLKASIDPVTAPIFILFLVTAGSHLQPNSVAQPMILLLSIIYVGAGVGGRVAGTYAVARLLKLPVAIRKYLGLSSSIQGGLNVGLALSLMHGAMRVTSGAALAPAQQLVAILLVGVLIYQLVGPLIVRYGVTHGAALTAPGPD